MVTYVYYLGEIIDKASRAAPARDNRSDLPAPAVQSFAAFASPIDGSTISSHRQRDRDLDASGSYDPRDTPSSWKKKRDERYEQRRRFASEP